MKEYYQEENIRRKAMLLQLFADPNYIPLKIKELAILLQVKKEDRAKLELILDELLDEGKIEISKRGKYSLAKDRVYEGLYTAHAKGFGFVTVEGREEDFFIPESETGSALHGDRVKIKLIRGKRGKRQEARVTEVLERANTELVGTYEKAGKGYGFIIPDNEKITRDIFVENHHTLGAENGMKVVVTITKYHENRNPEGRVTEILGFPDDVGVDILSIAKGFGLPMEFEDMVQKEAAEVSEISIVPEGRKDLRDVMMVTIDGEDAKDLDDAVSLSKEGDNYVLGVHIADVTHYVKENSLLDKEAKKRGTSVYLADRVIPMLPKALSNGSCSLNQKEDRYCLSCIMTIDTKGNVIDSEIAEGIINVNRRMSYTEVKKILVDKDEALREECAELVPMFEEMEELAALLRKRRFKKGSIDFDFPETKVILDENGIPVDIKPYDRNVATKLIEEFMLMANRCVAESMFWQELPFVYRTHESPDPDKIKELAHFVNNFGYVLKGFTDDIHPRELQKLLEKVDGRPEEALIARLTLRSMKKAKYETQCSGHFGLAFEYYCHFTSPIRRYPDLQIHRIIKENLRGKLSEKRIEHYNSILDMVAKHSSDTEVTAAEAERESVKLKKVEYMKPHIGEEFDAVISGVTSWGLYAELPNTVEGLVPIATIPGDYYRFAETDYSLYGETTGRRYTLGQSVRVRLTACDLYNRTIDFELV